jgi:hypothetical protein
MDLLWEKNMFVEFCLSYNKSNLSLNKQKKTKYFHLQSTTIFNPTVKEENRYYFAF